MPIRLARRAFDAIHAAAAAAHPHEACGLLLGADERIAAAVTCANVAADPRVHFEIDPVALIAAHRVARAGGPGLAGYFHSHPAGPPRPSATDRRHASGDGRIWAIVGGGTSAGELTLWRDTPQGFAALRYTLDPA